MTMIAHASCCGKKTVHQMRSRPELYGAGELDNVKSSSKVVKRVTRIEWGQDGYFCFMVREESPIGHSGVCQRVGKGRGLVRLVVIELIIKRDR